MAKMNMVLRGNFLPIALFLIVIASHSLAQRRPVDYVDPLIGTAPITDKQYLGNNPAPGEELYSGTVNPCAMVPDPEGYLCVGPVTGFDGAYHVCGSGYRFDDATIMGFTQMNAEYGDENRPLFMPTIGPIKTSAGARTDPFSGYRSTKDAQSEKASPGYYSVFLTTYGIKVELTATAHCGFHRYTFSLSRQANILIDLANSRPAVSNTSVDIVNKHTIEGFQTSGTDTVFIRAEFSKDFSSSGTWKNSIVTNDSSTVSGSPVGAFVTFNTPVRETILVRVTAVQNSEYLFDLRYVRGG